MGITNLLVLRVRSGVRLLEGVLGGRDFSTMLPLVLISKNGVGKELRDFMSLSLSSGGFHEILTMVLANRLKKVVVC